ncbi:PIN domain-containing protein [Methanosphaera sp.]|jgi:predicted nucleic acid-binding protein|uniref:PIN domain-containing protein n=1 Tax=Methanosphaera sp. TaxID=2666342 RepID=UPI0025DA5559|nr:PIN domain-containing protein [Methanosphaera sp.]MBE6487056.1 PIN domain-containing protein [Methanosphaera stadtmanae]MEE1117256.1 PIN domain-containing protein [Methanosphaera sp.]
MNKIFIDTNFIVAIFREIEENHELAVKTCETLLNNYECCISNSIITEVVTIIMMRTKNLNLTRNAYYFMIDNFTILNEYDIDKYNDKVFKVFEKYNTNRFNLGFVDCSIVVISGYYDMDYVVSFDKNFKLFEEITLYNL